MSDPNKRTLPDLHWLVDLFYQPVSELGEFEEIEAEAMPAPYQRMLVHHEHMTVAVEDYHQCDVDVHVLGKHVTDRHYSRKVVLTSKKDGRVVQLGIVRLNLDYLSPPVRQAIESEQMPLGRILISHGVLRNVRPLSFWKIHPGRELCELFQLTRPVDCYGRTALIYCDGVIAVELFELVAPVDEPAGEQAGS